MAIEMNTPDPVESSGQGNIMDDLGSRFLTPSEWAQVATQISNTGNEGQLGLISDGASLSGGKIGMKALAEGVDANFSARHGSRSANLSAGARGVHDQGHGNDGVDMPVARGEDMNPAIAAIYMVLASVGVSERMLNEAMSSDNSDRDTLEAFHEMAGEANLSEITEYIQGADECAMCVQLESGMSDVAPAIGTPEVVAENNMEMQLEPEGLTGPSAPAAPVV